MLAAQLDVTYELRQAVAQRRLDRVRAILSEISAEQARVVLDDLTVHEQAQLVELVGLDELRQLFPVSRPDDDLADVIASLDVDARRVLRLLRMLGPGLVTGASDDDPSGIATYSVAGAQLGVASLWTALFTFPLMAGVQYACAKIGYVSGMGLAGVLARRYPRLVVSLAVLTLLIANTINAGADLGAIGAALNLLVPGIPAVWWVAPVALLILALQLFGPYQLIARVFKWLTLALLAYVAVVFFIQPDWSDVLRATFIPTVSFDSGYVTTLVAILGTTISPYMFFWQTSLNIEEQVARGRIFLWQRLGASDAELRYAGWDVGIGMFLSNLVMYCIILAAAATLHTSGRADVRSAADVAEALRPLAGDFAAVLLAVGLVGTGFLAVPVLTGSGAYAVAEVMKWRYGLGSRLRRAARFYALITVATLAATAMNYLGINVIDALYWSSVINGVLAAPLLVL
ncbi:MAG TPA: divalent metal cation transporter, partial [Chloroflexota bacterium]|nr:divalent metal cation transporter [Chloroflexota bacterium]